MSAIPQTTQPPLLPTLYALIPRDSLESIQSSISLLSIHSEKFGYTDKVYKNEEPVLGDQERFLRIRITNRPQQDSSGVQVSGQAQGQGHNKRLGQGVKGKESIGLVYMSSRLREYEDVSVRAVLEVDVCGTGNNSKGGGGGGGGGGMGIDDVEDFVKTLGFGFSHQYTRSGTLFHLPLPHPTLTLQLTISSLSLPHDSPSDSSASNGSSEPYLLQLEPSRPISGVAAKGELGVTDLVDMMRVLAERIDGVEWGAGF